ncbi:MAG TPA: DNA adenine methylase [Anaerolineae bacterium]|nr:DNA adenine methylase [Anaerolineae bacterium]
MIVPHPIPYQGSKRLLANLILTNFPPNVSRLIEPFAGSGALSIATAIQKKADHFWLNDTNQPLVTLWQTILERPTQLADAYETLWRQQHGRERKFYDEVRREFNQTHQAEHLLYLLARCVKASVRYNAYGEFNQSPDNRRKGRHPTAMRRDIITTSRLLKGRTLVSCRDYRTVLTAVTALDVVYMDPPYQGVSTKRDARYANQIQFNEFVEALSDLVTRQIRFIVSYDGRRGDKVYGNGMPSHLNLYHIELHAGRSAQSTLLGRKESTYESLYLSPALVQELKLDPSKKPSSHGANYKQLDLPFALI